MTASIDNKDFTLNAHSEQRNSLTSAVAHLVEGIKSPKQAGANVAPPPRILKKPSPEQKQKREVQYLHERQKELAEEKRISTPTLKVLHALVKGFEKNFTRDI